METTLAPYDPRAHDADMVAGLIYQTDPSLMRFVFGPERAAVPLLARLVGMEHNEYSGRRIVCACRGSEITGIVAGLTGADQRRSERLAGKEWGRALGFRGLIRAMRYATRLQRVSTRDLADDEYYVSALSVSDLHRRQGVGSLLLLHACRDHRVSVTDVNIANDGAISFYQHHGFVIQKELTFPHRGRRLGNYQMRREV